jgi:putative transposase
MGRVRRVGHLTHHLTTVGWGIMPAYTRAFVAGGTFYFTLVTYRRRSILTSPEARQALRQAIRYTRARRPFAIEAIVLLPDHLHTIWTLPAGDADFSTRWRLIKYYCTRRLVQGLSCEARQSQSRLRKGERGIWQRRFWERTVRDEAEYQALCDYIHYNPVKHGRARCPHSWPYSSFRRFVAQRAYPVDWQCGCRTPRQAQPDIDVPPSITGE